MNAPLTIGPHPTSLIVVETLTPTVVFAPGGVETIISKLEAEVRAIPRDITTQDGRKAVKSLAYKVARSKTALDDMGKELVADIKKQSGAIDAERRIIRDRLDALWDEVRGPLTAWEEAETARVDGHERAIVFLVESPRFPTPPTSDEIRARIAEVAAICSRPWQEFNERAEAAATEATLALDAMFAAAVQREADAAELAELRRLKAEREAADIAAELDRKEAERVQLAADVAALAIAEAAEREKIAEAARSASVARELAEATAKAVEDERQRVATAAAAEKAAATKREANKRHRIKITLEALKSLEAHGISNDVASTVIEAIVRGEVLHLTINF